MVMAKFSLERLDLSLKDAAPRSFWKLSLVSEGETPSLTSFTYSLERSPVLGQSRR